MASTKKFCLGYSKIRFLQLRATSDSERTQDKAPPQPVELHLMASQFLKMLPSQYTHHVGNISPCDFN